MGLNSLIRSSVSIADNVTKTLQSTVLHSAWIGYGSYAEPLYSTTISRKALVEYKQRMYTMGNGQEIVQKAVITFVGPIEANGAIDRQEPLDSRDKITLPSGYTGPILSVEGVVDPSTNQPYMFVVVMG